MEETHQSPIWINAKKTTQGSQRLGVEIHDAEKHR